MVSYDLMHLSQPDDQRVIGPIQDDEALFLFSIIRGMRLRTILEVGGGAGYSARNFLAAVGPHGKVYTVDPNPVATISDNHIVVSKSIGDVVATDIFAEQIDLVFFDCH